MAEETMPIFVKIEEYKDVLETINTIKRKLEEAKSLLADIYRLKEEEDTELENWSNSIEEVEKKIAFVDKTLFEPEGI